MKTTVLAMILACALSAAADDAAQSQSQPSAGGGQQAAAPEIKDPNEYNAYVAAIQQKDPAAKTSALEAFLTNPADNEVDVAVQNVSLTEIRNPPYKAAVTFQKLLYTSGTRSERGHQTYVAQLDFVIRGHVPNEFVRVNPLGLQITYFRVDQAFEEAKQ